MTDRELLELAAKAVGMPVHVWGAKGRELIADMSDPSNHKLWNPLNDDGDALRLAVKLGIQVTPFLSGACAVATPDGWQRTESGYENGDAAARRAIVRAAAEIGRSA